MDRELRLADAAATLALGRALAKALTRESLPPALLLQGDLGAGKTTLVRGLVGSLPGSDQAEVSSPSFNICNLYPTTPPVAHCDLYRLEGMGPDDALLELLEDRTMLVVIEWAQFLDRKLWPDEALELSWFPTSAGRGLIIRTRGRTAREMLGSLAHELDHISNNPTGLQ
ncbi:tRNA (adenosine(37)-N6)-threonylcarbamoyltransferase complex ATPase subunit type 1 TsaE [Pseudodesulfovibrio sp. F-1]|uniref:tRNA threonylcarbamoyladenosine biosynthesis protein TsaE n=1 Tax=Pseudodesulfovibrio alkaliphilus TaxID=2661613 RepID=A0A7K1KR62_9BACT|nr:tRNA (adenosine(37)-N6)-threonylcarbamoyltransferase complex ATPase subunit type 1 TsaE [Pseudodesulfovibrio alkaliphilus]MUM78402.1 tRNA (adenosine(37)-N6)-threonylcarbamoyltransferase complex ATPase subunit type 1 TsaE [Pseudodesulfovibrio alkaliphilus]